MTALSWLLLAGLPVVPLLLTVVNLATWRRPRPGGTLVKTVSALVPARDEAATIRACVEALLAEPVDQVLVYDDGSTDETPRILADLAATDPRVQVIVGRRLPAGWVGKPHACHRLATAASGEVLLFVDADTQLLPGAVAALVDVPASVVTALPRQHIGSIGEGLIVPLLHLSYLSWLPLALVARSPDPRVLAANGQVLCIDRQAYDTFGGFAAVRDAIVDDMALCRAAKAAGVPVAFVPGDRLAQCRMYTSGTDAWRGFSKNLVLGVGGPVPALLTGALYAASFVLPWLLWPLAPVPATIGIAANLLQRAAIAVRFRLPLWTVAAHLPSALTFLGILVTSASWTLTGRVQWRGRTYAESVR